MACLPDAARVWVCVGVPASEAKLVYHATDDDGPRSGARTKESGQRKVGLLRLNLSFRYASLVLPP